MPDPSDRRAGQTSAGPTAQSKPPRGRRRRRVWVGHGRAHIEVKGLRTDVGSSIVERALAGLRSLEGVSWVELNPVLGRLVVDFDEEQLSLTDLLAVIEAVERAHDVHWHPLPGDLPDHPGDTEPLRRHLLAGGMDVLGLGLIPVARGALPGPLPAEIASAFGLVEATPKLRFAVESRLGAASTDLLLAAGSAVGQGLSQGPLGLLVDAAFRTMLVREHVARRAVWYRREPALSGAPERVAAWTPDDSAEPATGATLTMLPAERECPLQPGPIELEGNRAGLAGIAAGILTAAATRDLRAGAATALASTPKAGRLGREAFAAAMDRHAAARGIVSMDPTAFRRLDRIDTVLLDGRLLVTGHHELGTVEALTDGRHGQEFEGPALQLAAARLFDTTNPRASRKAGPWSLRPASSMRRNLELRRRAESLRSPGNETLVLSYRGHPVGLVCARPQLHGLAEAVTAAGRAVGRVALAGRSLNLGDSLPADLVVAGGPRLTQSLRELQCDGHGVLLVTGAGGEAVRVADVSVGVIGPGHTPPWGVDLLCGSDLSDVCLLLDATVAARSVSRRSALMSLYGSVAAALLALAGPSRSATRRAMLGVNGAAVAGLAIGTSAAAATARRPPPLPRDTTPWHLLEPEAALAEVVSSERGLSPAEVRRRQAEESEEAEESEPSIVRATVEELANPLTPPLAAGAGISAAVGSVTDAALISMVMAVNALLGGLQRIGAERAISKLEYAGEVRVRVVRDGHEVSVSSSELVLGDVIAVQAGDAIPVDCRVLTAVGLEVDESTLTGESQPVTKSVGPTAAVSPADRNDMLYAGTAVAAGTGTAVVVATGSRTEMGRAAHEDPGHHARIGVAARLNSLTKATVPPAIAAGAALMATGLVRGQPISSTIGSGVSLAVAAVPEGLPLIATVAQLSAARRLSRRNALVRRPATIEALGRVDVLAFDKTGTLTEGRIRLHRVDDGTHDEPLDALSASGRAVLCAALRATPRRPKHGKLAHPTDRAILHAGDDADARPDTDQPGWQIVDELPFEPSRGFHAVLGAAPGGYLLSVKGAPEVVLPRCIAGQRNGRTVRWTAAARQAMTDETDRLARHGYRVLAVAERAASGPDDLSEERVNRLNFVGLLGLADPVRPAASGAVDGIRQAGVRVVMLTGDHPSTAEAVAAELGLLDEGAVVTGPEIDMMDDRQLRDVAAKTAVFARVSPAHKVRIVAAFQANGGTVAVTGDGANDAPAIRLADVGLALGRRGTNAAREAADVVIADDRIETIVDAIIEGRAMWASVRDAIAVLLGGNLGEIAFALGTGLVSPGGAALNARQLLLVNLMTDMLPSLALAVRPPTRRTPEQLLHEGPDASLGPALARDIVVRAVATASGAELAWLAGRLTGTRAHASTVALVALVGAQLGQTLVAGYRSPLVVSTSLLSAGALGAIIQTPGVSQMFGCRPLGPAGWAIGTSASVAATVGSTLVSPAIGLLRRGRDYLSDFKALSPVD